MAVAGRSTGSVPRARTAAVGTASRATPWLLGAILALGALVRFSTLGEQSFWFDEATTWTIVSHGFGHVLVTVPRTESTPYLYYVLLWLWSQLFGITEAGLRSLSALAGVATIGALYVAGRRLIGERAGLIAALLAAVNPLLFWYSQEARAYSLLVALCAGTLITWAGVVQSPTWRRCLAWGVTAALALATHYYAALLIAGEAATLGVVLVRRRELTAGRLAAGLAPVVAAGGALLPLLLHQNDGRAGPIAAQGGSLAHRLAQLAKQDIIGQGQPAKVLLTSLGAALVVAGVIPLARRRSEVLRGAVGRLAAIGLGAIALALVLALVGPDYFDTRNLLVSWPPLALVVAAGLARLRPPRVQAAIVGGLVLLGLFCVGVIVADPGYQRTDWGGAARALGAVRSPRAIVTGTQSQVPLTPYLGRLRVLEPGTVRPLREVDLVWIQRRSEWGALAPFHPVALPGFASMQVIRTSAYDLVRYRSDSPVPETPTALDRLYPGGYPALALLQG